jgi:hypothetical protein
MATGEIERARRERTPPWPLGPILLSVALAGVSAYTFRYAEGFSYLKTDPKACVNCHILRPQYDGWSKSSHRAVAVCTPGSNQLSFVRPAFTRQIEAMITFDR